MTATSKARTMWRLDYREMRATAHGLAKMPGETGTTWHDSEGSAMADEKRLLAMGWQVYVYEVEVEAAA